MRITQHLLAWLALSMVVVAAASTEYPSQISLRAGVLHAPPFAFVESTINETDATAIPGSTSNLTFRGFQIDLLERIKHFAAEDNVTLDIDLFTAPPQYVAAFDMVANDCTELVEDPNDDDNDNTKTCNQLDIIVGGYYATPDRAMRAALSPAWLRTTVTTMKYLGKHTGSPDITTLAEAAQAQEKVCLLDGTFYQGSVKAKHPMVDFLMCASGPACLEALKAEECTLLAWDELVMKYMSAWDDTLEVTRELISTQYVLWPMSERLPLIVHRLMERWIFAVVNEGTIDDLYHQYFQKASCPLGTAGEACELSCDPTHGTSSAKGKCVCDSAKWTGDDCSIEIQEDMNAIPGTFKVLAYGMLVINIVVIFGCGIWLYKYRGTPQISFSQPFFLLLVLLGCLISSSTIIVLAQDHEHADSCMAIPWLYSVGFSVTFGTLLSKILRVWLIFTQAGPREAQCSGASTTKPRARFGTFRETLGVIGAVLLIDVTILTAWTVIDPLEWQRTIVSTDQFGSPLESQAFCTSEHWYLFFSAIAAFHMLLLAIACWLCYVSRVIPTKFSEGKFVSIAIISNFQILIVGVPILVIVGDDSGASLFVRSAIIWMNDLAVVSIIFGHLMYSIHCTPLDPMRSSSDSMQMRIAVSRYSTGPRVGMDERESNGSPGMQAQQRQCCCDASPPPQRRDAPFSVSSLSLGSYVPTNEHSFDPVKKRAKIVSWGVIQSENEENSEIPGLSEDKTETEPKVGCTRRFSTDPVQGAPARPKRILYVSENAEDAPDDLTEGGTSEMSSIGDLNAVHQSAMEKPQDEEMASKIGAWMSINPGGASRGVTTRSAELRLTSYISTPLNNGNTIEPQRWPIDDTSTSSPRTPARTRFVGGKGSRNSAQPQRQHSVGDSFDEPEGSKGT